MFELYSPEEFTHDLANYSNMVSQNTEYIEDLVNLFTGARDLIMFTPALVVDRLSSSDSDENDDDGSIAFRFNPDNDPDNGDDDAAGNV